MVARMKSRTWLTRAALPRRPRRESHLTATAEAAEPGRPQATLHPGVVAQALAAPRQLSPGAVQLLQCTVGNQAIQRLLAPAGGSAPTAPAVQRDDDFKSKKEMFEEFARKGGRPGGKEISKTVVETGETTREAFNRFGVKLRGSRATPQQRDMTEAGTGEPAPKVGTDYAKPNKYQTKGLIDSLEAERLSHKPGSGYAWFAGVEDSTKVKYLETEEERAKYELKLDKEKNVFKLGDKAYDTSSFRSVNSKSGENGRCIFVLTENGVVYVANQAEHVKWKHGLDEERALKLAETSGKTKEDAYANFIDERFNHSSFLAGQPVAAAGEMWFENGVLKGISDSSGHYQPGLTHTMQMLRQLQTMGADLSGVIVERFGARPIYADDLLRLREDPREEAFDVLEEIAQVKDLDRLGQLLEQGSKLSPELMRQFGQVPQRIDHVAGDRLEDVYRTFKKAAKKSGSVDLEGVANDLSKVLNLLTISKQVFGDKVDDKKIATVTELLDSTRQRMKEIGGTQDSDQGHLEQMRDKTDVAVGAVGNSTGTKVLTDVLAKERNRLKYWDTYHDAAVAALKAEGKDLIDRLEALYKHAQRYFLPALRAAERQGGTKRVVVVADTLAAEADRLEQDGDADGAKRARDLAAAIEPVVGVQRKAIQEQRDRQKAAIGEKAYNKLVEALDDWENDETGYCANELHKAFTKAGKSNPAFVDVLTSMLKERQRTLQALVKDVLLVEAEDSLQDMEWEDVYNYYVLANVLIPGSVSKSDVDEVKERFD
jgi:hypothetical protein